jgi:hypothetical protein
MAGVLKPRGQTERFPVFCGAAFQSQGHPAARARGTHESGMFVNWRCWRGDIVETAFRGYLLTTMPPR